MTDQIDAQTEQRSHQSVGDINEIVGFNIGLAHGAVYRHFMDTFSDLGLTQKQVSVLWLVDDNPGVSQADLGRKLNIDRATIMAIVNRLQARGFLRRLPSPEDGRRQILQLLPEGRKALEDAHAAILEHEKWLKGKFSAGELTQFMEFLNRIHQGSSF